MATSNITSITDFLAQQTADQLKAQEVITEIRKQNENNKKALAAKQIAANKAVSLIQKTTAENIRLQAEADKKALEESHKAKLMAVGLTAEAYPIATSLLAVDQKVASPVLGFFGKIGKVAAVTGKYIGGKVKDGYKQ